MGALLYESGSITIREWEHYYARMGSLLCESGSIAIREWEYRYMIVCVSIYGSEALLRVGVSLHIREGVHYYTIVGALLYDGGSISIRE